MWWCGVQSSHLCVSSFFQVVKLLVLRYMQFISEFIWAMWGLADRHKPETIISFLAVRLCLLMMYARDRYTAREAISVLKRSYLRRQLKIKNKKRIKTNGDESKNRRPLSGGLPTWIPLEGKDEAGRKAEYRVAKQDLPLLPDSLQIPDVFKCPLRNILRRDGRIVHASPEVCLTMSLLRHYLVHLWKVCSRNLHDKQSSYGLDLREPWSSHHNMNNIILNSPALQKYTDAIFINGAPHSLFLLCRWHSRFLVPFVDWIKIKQLLFRVWKGYFMWQ